MSEGLLPDSASTANGRLEIGGCDAEELARRFGTPLVVMDRATIEARARAFASVVGAGNVFYAAKAFCCIAMCELIDSLGLGLDVCTGGELATALAAGVDPDRLLLHGNNKSPSELEAARDAGVGRVVVDSFEDIRSVSSLGLSTRLVLRVTPGVEAHTHEFVQTGQEDSKFGFTLGGGVALEALGRALDIEGCEVTGIHFHIGSQIFELAAFELAIRRVADYCVDARNKFGFVPAEINVGGGLGIAHTRDELTPDPTETTRSLRDMVAREFGARDLDAPEVLVEPGRALVGASAVTLYTVGAVKTIPGVRTYVAVDGGMSDNIRPALYGARYEALLANRTDAPVGPRMTVCGKHCESGDVLIRDVHLPEDVAPGDLLCVPATGAYTYSMASNYNRVPRPGVVLVADGEATVMVERESHADLLRLDRRLPR